ncbi:MAG: tetraacyldisaccharide 4'-kinase [Deltaproteobacteria bacterium]|nr:tetraacyldisaccharide 4'-kinase [Deltaproteobacteria bacterium]
MAKSEIKTSGSQLQRLWYGSRLTLSQKILGATLAPLSWAYWAGHLFKVASGAKTQIECPVISVGNLSVGGNGKTPLVIDIANRLTSLGKKVAVISRGYRRSTRGLVVVSLPGQDVQPVELAGDEPVLIARRCPDAAVVVGADRVAAARKAIEVCNPDVIICDDAFQHRKLHRNFDIVAVHAVRGFGNGRLLPRGPLREPKEALSRANLVVFTYAKDEDVSALLTRHGLTSNIQACLCDFTSAGFVSGEKLELVDPPPTGSPVMAVSAIANPLGFERSLQATGLQVAKHLIFPDHHHYTKNDIEQIESEAQKLDGSLVVTTEKDLVRMDQFELGRLLLGLRIEARWTGDDLLIAQLTNLIT